MIDAIGQKIYAGDLVIFGKSDRYQPINMGEVHTVGEDFIDVKGFGNKKTSRLKSYTSNDQQENRLGRVYVIDKDSYYELQSHFDTKGGWEDEF